MTALDVFLVSLWPVGRFLLQLAAFFAFWIFVFNPAFLVVQGRAWVEQVSPGQPFSPGKLWFAWARRLVKIYAYLVCGLLILHAAAYLLNR